MDLNKLFIEKSEKIISDKLPEIVEAQLEKVVSRVIEDVFSVYGDFSKSLKESISKKLEINLKNFDLVDYNGLVATTIQKELNKLVVNNSVAPITELVKNVTGYIDTKKLYLSDIFEKIKEFIVEDNYEDSGSFSFYVTEDEEKGWFTVSFDVNDEINEDKCSTEFLISSGSHKTIFILRTKSTWDKRRTEVDPIKLVQLNNIQHYLFRLYSAGVEVEVDETYFDTDWNKYEY